MSVEVVSEVYPRMGKDARCNLVGVICFELDLKEMIFTFTKPLLPGELGQVARGKVPLPDTVFLEFNDDGIVEALAIIPQDVEATVLAVLLEPGDQMSPTPVADIEAGAGKIDSQGVIFVECMFHVARLEPLETSYSMITPKE